MIPMVAQTTVIAMTVRIGAGTVPSGQSPYQKMASFLRPDPDEPPSIIERPFSV